MRKPEPNPEAAAMYDGPSKTQVKREMHELQDLGLALLNLPVAQRDAIAMDDRLREALREYHRMPTRESKRRHMQYVGKLLRDTDSAPARLALEQIRAGETRVLTTGILMYTQMGRFEEALALAAVLLGMTFVLAAVFTVVQQGRRP